MNKKGFTLVELLAVIAILAILVIIAMPNVLKMFNQAKQDSFETEVQSHIKAVSNEFISTGHLVYSNVVDGAAKLPMDGEEIDYYIEVDSKGNIKELNVTNGDYKIETSGTSQNPVKIEDIGNTVQVEVAPSGENFAMDSTGSISTGKVVECTVTNNNDFVSNIDNCTLIKIPSTVSSLTLINNVNLSKGVKLVFEGNTTFDTGSYSFNLNGGTLTTNGTLTVNGTITIKEGNSVINGSGMIKRGLSKILFNVQTANSKLDIKGVTLDGGVESTADKTPMIMIRNGAIVNVKDNAVIQNSVSAKTGSAAINIGLGTLNIDGAIIRNNTLTASKGGAIYMRDGATVNVKNAQVYGNSGNNGSFIGEEDANGGCTVNIYDGANIYDNKVSSIIYLRKTSVVNIYGGTFKNNVGIYAQNTGSATLNLMGGNFDNTNQGYFSGNNYNSVINVSGKVNINPMNTKLVFANGNASGLTTDIIFITGKLDSGANITLNKESVEHIISRTKSYIAKGKNYTITDADVAKFNSDSYTFTLDKTNNAIMATAK